MQYLVTWYDTDHGTTVIRWFDTEELAEQFARDNVRPDRDVYIAKTVAKCFIDTHVEWV